MNRDELLTHLKSNTRVLRSPEIEEAFRKVDRADFVASDYQPEAYEDYALPIGWNQTISQPTTVAFMLELLDPKPDEAVLDVGTGSGWTTALLANIVGPSGSVRGVEILPELAAVGRKNIAPYHFENATIEEASGDVGLPREGPYDKILVSATTQEIPEELLLQLKPDGTMVLPVGNSIVQVKGAGDGNFETKEFPGFVFVPLIKKS